MLSPRMLPHLFYGCALVVSPSRLAVVRTRMQGKKKDFILFDDCLRNVQLVGTVIRCSLC